MDHVVVDIEIANSIEETPGGWNATDKLGVAVACVWEYKSARMRVYGPEDVGHLCERLLQAKRVSGYNIWNFDFPVIFRIPKQDWLRPPNDDILRLKEQMRTTTNDLYRRILLAQGFDPDGGYQYGMGDAKVDDVAPATIGVKKLASGIEAPKWYKQGLVHKVVNYCADDVAIERDLVDFVDRYGYIIHRGRQLLLARTEGR